jgi:hypothetical protein
MANPYLQQDNPGYAFSSGLGEGIGGGMELLFKNLLQQEAQQRQYAQQNALQAAREQQQSRMAMLQEAIKGRYLHAVEQAKIAAEQRRLSNAGQFVTGMARDMSPQTVPGADVRLPDTGLTEQPQVVPPAPYNSWMSNFGGGQEPTGPITSPLPARTVPEVPSAFDAAGQMKLPDTTRPALSFFDALAKQSPERVGAIPAEAFKLLIEEGSPSKQATLAHTRATTAKVEGETLDAADKRAWLNYLVNGGPKPVAGGDETAARIHAGLLKPPDANFNPMANLQIFEKTTILGMSDLDLARTPWGQFFGGGVDGAQKAKKAARDSLALDTAQAVQIGKATGAGHIEAALDAPAPAKKRADHAHVGVLMQTGELQQPPHAATNRDVDTGPYVEVNDEQKKMLTGLKRAENITVGLFALADKTITATSPATVAAQVGNFKRAEWLRDNPLAATYAETRKAFLGNLSREVGGERGVLTDRDIERVAGAIPGEWDTVEIKNLKKALINDIISGARHAKIMEIAGRPSEMATFQSQVQKRLDELTALDNRSRTGAGVPLPPPPGFKRVGG